MKPMTQKPKEKRSRAEKSPRRFSVGGRISISRKLFGYLTVFTFFILK